MEIPAHDKDNVFLLLEKSGNMALLEFHNLVELAQMKKDAESRSVHCTIISLEDYLARYRGHRYFDMRSPETRQMITLDYLLKMWEAGDLMCQNNDGEIPPWIIH